MATPNLFNLSRFPSFRNKGNAAISSLGVPTSQKQNIFAGSRQNEPMILFELQPLSWEPNLQGFLQEKKMYAVSLHGLCAAMKSHSCNTTFLGHGNENGKVKHVHVAAFQPAPHALNFTVLRDGRLLIRQGWSIVQCLSFPVWLRMGWFHSRWVLVFSAVRQEEWYSPTGVLWGLVAKSWSGRALSSQSTKPGYRLPLIALFLCHPDAFLLQCLVQ